MTTSTARARAAVQAATQDATTVADPGPVEVETQPQAMPDPAAEVAVIAPRSNIAPTRGTMPDKIQYARALAEASLLPKAYQRQPGNVLLAVEMGEALGLHPYVAIQGIHVIEGKPTASAALISALVRRAGHRLRITGNDEKATCQIIRIDDPEFVYESVWDLDRARKAGLLGKGTWEKYTAAMLKARAITECARDACQEALSGVQYTPEEMGAQVDGDGDVVGYTVTQQPVAHVDGRDWFADVALCKAVEDCRALYKRAHEVGELTPQIAQAIAERAADLGEPAQAEPAQAENVNTETGEVTEAPEGGWPETARPGSE
jgi:hypothetical protein